ncbi:hypothetical protein CYY_005563 [Polysphondylium violaceum]|uniref:Ankyrin repeat-containing protein n=1 Tax=Polysphondylium violaceum TaxID=133409 RepID=A0A8J4PTF8_9MYCE|nr:hypothetical protein CYY_005563 [Polysphondylium violaceum]
MRYILTLTGDSDEGIKSILDVFDRKCCVKDKEKTLRFNSHEYTFKTWDQYNPLFQVNTEADRVYYYQSPSSMYRGQVVSIITHWIDSHQSFNNLRKWAQIIDRYARATTPIIVVGFYKDLYDPKNISREHYYSVYNFPYYEFQIGNKSTQEQFNFDKSIMEIVDYFYQTFFPTVFYDLIVDKKTICNNNNNNNSYPITSTTIPKKTTTTTTTTITVANPKHAFFFGTSKPGNEKEEDDIENLPTAYINHNLDSSKQSYYEAIFFKVFRNKLLFKLIFTQIHWIHQRYNITAYSFYSSPFSLFIQNQRLDLVKQRLELQNKGSDSLYIWDQFSFMNVINFLRVNNNYQLFQIVYDQFQRSFTLDKIQYNSDSDQISPQILESAVIGGNIEIVKFLVSKKFECNERALQFAVVLGHLDILKYIIKEKVFIVTPTLMTSLLQLSTRYNRSQVQLYLVKISHPSFIKKLMKKFTVQ